MVDLNRLQISAATFSEFVAARSSDRLSTVRQAIDIYGREYDPKTDYYKKMRDALERSISVGDDDPVRRAVAAAPLTKRTHYDSIASGWCGWKPRHRSRVSAARGTWEHGDLVLRARPMLTIALGSETLLVSTYIKSPVLTEDGGQVLTRVMELAMPQITTRMAVLDVRRNHLIKARKRRDKDFDVFVETEAASFEKMFWSIRRGVA